MENKYWYFVGETEEDSLMFDFNKPECITSGYVLLTPQEANIVKYATDKSKWQKSKLERRNTNFYIDLDNPLKEIESGGKHGYI